MTKDEVVRRRLNCTVRKYSEEEYIKGRTKEDNLKTFEVHTLIFSIKLLSFILPFKVFFRKKKRKTVTEALGTETTLLSRDSRAITTDNNLTR